MENYNQMLRMISQILIHNQEISDEIKVTINNAAARETTRKIVNLAKY